MEFRRFRRFTTTVVDLDFGPASLVLVLGSSAVGVFAGSGLHRNSNRELLHLMDDIKQALTLAFRVYWDFIFFFESPRFDSH